jgi:hypothetical protein
MRGSSGLVRALIELPLKGTDGARVDRASPCSYYGFGSFIA